MCYLCRIGSQFKLLGIFYLISLINLNCERAEPVKPETPKATLSSIQTTIFNSNCAISGCHLGSSAPFELDLSEGNSFGKLVNTSSQEVPSLLRVKPDDPDNSYLVIKIENGPNIVGQQMPLGRPPLSQEQINSIREWILDGAKNN
jgi:hypothetical protein